jgi:hypothetical protein
MAMQLRAAFNIKKPPVLAISKEAQKFPLIGTVDD